MKVYWRRVVDDDGKTKEFSLDIVSDLWTENMVVSECSGNTMSFLEELEEFGLVDEEEEIIATLKQRIDELEAEIKVLVGEGSEEPIGFMRAFEDEKGAKDEMD